MLNACILLATSLPILPSPMMANVFPFNSSPIKAERCQAPDFSELHAAGILLNNSHSIFLIPSRIRHLAKEQINAHVCSAAERVLPPGVLKDDTDIEERERESRTNFITRIPC